MLQTVATWVYYSAFLPFCAVFVKKPKKYFFVVFSPKPLTRPKIICYNFWRAQMIKMIPAPTKKPLKSRGFLILMSLHAWNIYATDIETVTYRF